MGASGELVVVAQALMEVARSASVKVDVRVHLRFPEELLPGASWLERHQGHIINPVELPTVADVVRDIRSHWRVRGDFSVRVKGSMVRWSMSSSFFRDDDVVELRMATLAAPGDRGRILCSGCKCNDPAEFSTWQWTRFCQGRTARCSTCVREADIMVPSKTHVNNAGKSQQKKQRSAGTVKKRAEVCETVQQDVGSELSELLSESELDSAYWKRVEADSVDSESSAEESGLSDLDRQARMRAENQLLRAEKAALQQELSVDTPGALSGLKTGGRQRKKARKAAMQDTHLRNSDSESSEELDAAADFQRQTELAWYRHMAEEELGPNPDMSSWAQQRLQEERNMCGTDWEAQDFQPEDKGGESS